MKYTFYTPKRRRDYKQAELLELSASKTAGAVVLLSTADGDGGQYAFLYSQVAKGLPAAGCNSCPSASPSETAWDGRYSALYSQAASGDPPVPTLAVRFSPLPPLQLLSPVEPRSPPLPPLPLTPLLPSLLLSPTAASCTSSAASLGPLSPSLDRDAARSSK